MNGEQRYLVDANIFIEAKNRHYGFDICPGFWDVLIKLYRLGAIASIDQVRRELIDLGSADELSDWAKDSMPKEFFEKADSPDVVQCYTDIISWVYNNDQYFNPAKSEFASGADGWLIAYARARDLVVVTHEAFAASAKRRVPMPNVCHQFGVRYIGAFEMLRELEVRLVCGSH